jgi:transcriptional regulator GlxA family with amidase domain
VVEAGRLVAAVLGRAPAPSRPAPGALEPLSPWSHAPARAVAEGSDREVAVLIYRGVSSAEVELVADALARPLEASVRLVSADACPVVAVEPTRQILTVPLDEVPGPLALVVPGGLAWRREANRPEVSGWLQAAAQTARGVIAVSTGSLLLAAAGLLDDREATGHWLAGDLLADLGARPSSARIVRGRLLVTAAGARAGVEAATELAREIRFSPWSSPAGS